MFTHLVVSGVKKNLFENTCDFQIAKPEHRPEEHLYVLKSLMIHREKYNEVLIFQAMDLSKFFDKEVLVDILDVAKNKMLITKSINFSTT